MRELEISFDEGLRNGIVPNDSFPVNSPYMSELLNVRCGKGGLEPYVPVLTCYNNPQAFPIGPVPIDWPFPQVFDHKTVRVLGTRTALYSLSNAGVLAKQLDTAETGLWEIADFHGYQVGTRDGGVVYERSPATGMWAMHNPHASIPYCKSICSLNGQAIAGGLLPWSSFTGVDEAFYAWSNIGEADFVINRKNESGFRRYGYPGEVLRVMPLSMKGKGAFVVYGDYGIELAFPVMEPAATFGTHNMMGSGIAGEGAVGGDITGHCFVTNTGDLYTLDESGPKYRGFSNLFDSMIGDEIMVSFDKANRDFYISNGSVCYLLTEDGMSRVYQNITSLYDKQGVLYGVREDTAETEFLAVTHPMDMNYRGEKTIFAFEVGCSGSGTFSIAVDWKKSLNSVWQRTQWVELNDHGIASLIISGVEFRLCLKCSSFADVKVDYIKVRYKMTDLRSLRGIYTSPGGKSA